MVVFFSIFTIKCKTNEGKYMAPSVSLLYILFTIGFLFKRSTGVPQLELGINFLEEPGDVTTVKGKSLSMPCKPRTSRQKEPVQIVWYHDNRRMDLGNDRRRTIFQNGTLHFSKVVHKKTGHSDQGEYRCVAIKENGSLSSRPAYLRISSLPEVFSRHPTDQSVEAGSNVRLTCDAGHGSDVEIEWEKDETRISANPGKYAIVWKPDTHESVLYITNAGADDSGNYRCVARSLLTNKQRHSPGGLLEVVVPDNERKSGDLLPLTFLSAQQSSSTLSTSVREIKEGENVTLDCVTNKYSNSILGWTFSGQDDNSTRSLVNTTKNSGCDLMVLKKVTRHQAGWYTCTALDSTDQTTRKLKFELRVLIPPEIQDMSDSIIFRTSKTVRFRCVVHGVPVPEVYWLKDGNIFNITGRIKHRTSVNESFHTRHSELIVSSTVANDAGIYECMTKNPVGWSWAASRLLLNATRPAPGAPERVSCEPISSSQIRLTWDVSNLTSEIKAFSVHYHLTDDGEEMQKVMPSNSRSIQIDKLLPFSNYTFYLRLYMDSASEFSEKAVCQTGEEVPTDAPEKKLQIITQNSVYVSWIPLEKEKARGVITKYKIQWRNTKSPSSRVAEVTGNVLSYTITGLDPGKKYDVRILAATSKGFPHSDLPWETFEIPSDFTEFNSNIPSPPKVTLEALNSSGVEVKWKLPNKESKVIGYKIFYRKLNSDQVGPIIVPPDTNKYVVAGLEPETWYEIMVLGFTQEDDGESGAGFIHTLSNLGSPSKVPAEFSTIPEPPLSLEADPISPVAINLTWKVPQTPPGFNSVKHYTVCFNPVQTSSNKNVTVTCMKSLENKISIVGLHPYTLYEFKVKTHGLNDQQSVFSQVMECHTLEGVPSQVTDINWKPINKTVVQVSWKEPRHANGILKSYTVSYTDDANLPLESWNAKILSSATCETQLTHLSSNVNYYLIIRASTNAGLGAYAPPKQIFILSKSAARNKPSDHYIGIVVGLGIGIFCIIICTTCILCRRRCLKRQVSQEFEVPSCRQSNGSSCQRDREMTAESRETEYFTFLSSQREPPNSLEITVRHLDTKGNYSNGSANGIKMSLLGESRTPKDGLGKTGLYLNEKSRSDRSTSESPLLMCKIEGNVHRGGDGADLIFYGYRHNQQESSTPLLLTGRQKRSGSTGSSGSENIDFEPESCSKVKRTSPGSKRLEPARKRTDGLADADTERRQVYTQCDQSNLSSILENPEFRFSNLSSEYVNRNCGYARQSFLYNGYNGETNDDGNETEVDCSIFQESKLPLHFVSKEIVQES